LKQPLKRGQIIYGFKTPDGKTFYVPGGIKVLAVRESGIKLRYNSGDIEIVNPQAHFIMKRGEYFFKLD
jgi:hypothetical protein